MGDFHQSYLSRESLDVLPPLSLTMIITAPGVAPGPTLLTFVVLLDFYCRYPLHLMILYVCFLC